MKNHQDVACLCPVSPSQGTCGIPTSFDLFGGNLNIFRIPIGWTGKKNMADSDVIHCEKSKFIGGVVKKNRRSDWEYQVES